MASVYFLIQKSILNIDIFGLLIGVFSQGSYRSWKVWNQA